MNWWDRLDPGMVSFLVVALNILSMFVIWSS